MIREEIVEEVIKILHGPIGGVGEELDKNPLDFYSVGVLFPVVKNKLGDQESSPETVETNVASDEDEVGLDDGNGINVQNNAVNDNLNQKRADKEGEESEDSGEFELTTKFRPSAAGLSIIAHKNADINIEIKFATYKKTPNPKAEKDGPKNKVSYYKHLPTIFSFKSKNGLCDFLNCNVTNVGKIVYVNLNGCAKLAITTRPYPRNPTLEIKTFTLINSKEVNKFSEQKKAEDCIFQPLITIDTTNGFQPFEDMTDLALLSPEDLNLKLLYRNYKKYALGHGISVNWDKPNNVVKKIFTEVLPQENVNGVDLNPPIFKNKDILYMKRLGGSTLNIGYDWKSIKNELNEFVNLYRDWIISETNVINTNKFNLRPELINQAKSNLKQCNNLWLRMLNGIQLLDTNLNARKAFEDANRAMFMQRVMADFSKHRRNESRVQYDNSNNDDALPDYTQIHFDATSGAIWQKGILNIGLDINKKGTLAKWRPFQLAFLLSQIEGIIDPASADRDTVDLIWFPTGGGKTEAYLGLTAFTIFYRRLHAKLTTQNPDKGAGVTVLMRYTLRLLNKQQFERASIVICACDLIRRNEIINYGKERISNGIWMGKSMTPNSDEKQQEAYSSYINNINRNRAPDTFLNSPPILSCPCCGNRLVRESLNNVVIGRWGYFRMLNMANNPTGPYLIACTNTRCDFYVTQQTLRNNLPKTLPIYEVDETIYQKRPSLVFSTVDKFVQLAWKSGPFNLFNINLNNNTLVREFPAPELIIQDELHLISAALGTIYGVFEIVIEKMCCEAGGFIPKIIGATATVRNAEQQCKRLYGRSHFMQFPPPGTDADDSFYAKKITGVDPKNRLYVGFMPSGVTTSTALIRLASVLLERIPAIKLSNEEVDKHYTLVIYFNALKELGKFRTFLTDDIVAYRKLLANHFNTFIKPFNNNSLCELSSVMTADDITKGLDQLEKTTLPKNLDIADPLIMKLFAFGIRSIQDLRNAKGPLWKKEFINQGFFSQYQLNFKDIFRDDINTFISFIQTLFIDRSQPIHIAPATNMISVGVDIPRLNTMIVNGQPKTSAEYIQASSRVGREDPGVVFTFLSPTKNRDRSHYEQFKAFHQAYYYFVESSSVTPYSIPALEKVLPTVFIALTRSLYLNGNNGVFDSNAAGYKNFIELISKEIIERGSQILGNVYKQEIVDIINKIEQKFLDNMNNLGGIRRLATHGDFMTLQNGRFQIQIVNQLAIYNAQAQFTENILKDHIPTMGTLRNVESSTKILIKN